MPQAKFSFSFPIFYSIVFRDNSFLKSQGDIMNILLFGHPLTSSHSGETTISVQTSNHYTLGRRPIPDSYRVAIFELPTETVADRIRQCHIKNPQAAANGIMSLIQSADVSFSKQKAERMLDWYRTEDEETFLAKALISSMECEYSCDDPLDQDAIAILASYRNPTHQPTVPSKTEKTAPAEAETESITAAMKADEDMPEQVHIRKQKKSQAPPLDENAPLLHGIWAGETTSSPMSGRYSARVLKYPTDSQELKKKLLFIEGTKIVRPIDEDDALERARCFRDSEGTFMIEYVGLLPGLSDVLLHRINEKQATQIIILSATNSDVEYIRAKETLKRYIRHCLSDEGVCRVTLAFDARIPKGEYRMRAIFSLKEMTPSQRQAWHIAADSPPSSLTPYKSYKGRVPLDLLPYDPNDYDDEEEKEKSASTYV